MNRTEILARALQAYPFREAEPHESPVDYLSAMCDHIEQHDFAAAHEIRLGKLQADWTPEEVDAFRVRISSLPRAKQEVGPHEAIPWLAASVLADIPATEASLVVLADAALEDFKERRTRDPFESFPIVLHLLLVDGRFMAGFCNRGDRVAITRWAVQHLPVFGFFVIADAWMHGIGNTRAIKFSALVVNVGTRDLARAMIRPYEIVGGRTKWLDVPPDIDKRGPDMIDDPYAGVFVSVPPSEGAPS